MGPFGEFVYLKHACIPCGLPTHYIAEDSLELAGIPCTWHHFLFPSGSMPRLYTTLPVLSNTLMSPLLTLMYVARSLQGKERS